MKIKEIFLILLLVFFGNIYAKQIFAQEKFKNISTVNLCDLIENSAEYQNKVIRIKATYRYGYHYSELFCSDCWTRDKGRIYVFFDEAWQENSKPDLINILTNKGDEKTINVTFIGLFADPNPSDKRTAPFQFKFTLIKVEKAEVLTEDSPAPPNLKKKIKKKTFCKN